MFSYFEGGLLDLKPACSINITLLLNTIKNNPNKDGIENLHQTKYATPEYDNKKIVFPCITPHGIIENWRNNENLKTLSGYLYYDIDFSETQRAPEEVKKGLLNDHHDKICLIGKSIGGRSIFFFIRDTTLTFQNFDQVYHYYKNNVFGNWPTDDNAKGLSRAMFLPYDPDVYYKDISLTSSNKIITTIADITNPNKFNNVNNYRNDKKIKKELKGVLESIKKREKKGYGSKYSFTDISVLLKKYIFKTHVTVNNPIFDIKPIAVVEVFFPRLIKDGKKHKIFTTITNRMMYLNPEITLHDIQSYVNYLNSNFTGEKPMALKEMLNTVEAAYNNTVEEGVLIGGTRTKNIHFKEGCPLSGDEKRNIAARENGILKKQVSLKKIQHAIEKLTSANLKITKKKIAEITGLSLSTINLRIKHINTGL